MLKKSPFNSTGQWDTVSFFRSLVARNKLSKSLSFGFGSCAGLQGFYDALSAASSSPNFISIDDSSDGMIIRRSTWRVQYVKTVYFSMRHKVGDLNARNFCLSQMREIFRQFMSVLVKERVRLDEDDINIDPNINFSEIDRDFCTGAACAFFQISVDIPMDVCFNPDEWSADESE